MTMTAAAPIVGIGRHKMNSIVFASCFGTIIEWYDFLIYATAATLVFNKAFFPTFDPLASTLAALGTYAVDLANLAHPPRSRRLRSAQEAALNAQRQP
jgi:MFS transporter, MHS family, shikimate and dehydroshikimate transport protein